MKAMRFAEADKLDLAKGLREYVEDNNQVAIHILSKPVVGTVHMLHCALVVLVSCDLDRGFIVEKKRGGSRHVVTFCLFMVSPLTKNI